MPTADALKLSPYIVVKRGAEAIAFYTEAFGATELYRMTDPGSGAIGHAELQLGASVLMLAEEYPDFGALSPDTIGGTPVSLQLAVADIDAITARAEALGAQVIRKPTDQAFGERTAHLQDPEGHRWLLSQSIKDMSPQEMQQAWNDETGA